MQKNILQGQISFENSSLIKFLAMVHIIICHFNYDFPFNERFQDIILPGNISVGIFLFLSAYGLSESESKRPNTILHFLFSRILRLIIPLLLIVCSSCLIFTLFHIKEFEFNFYLSQIINNWFVQVILVFYVLFIISFKISRKRDWRAISISFLTMLYIFIVSFIFKLSSTYINAILAFPMGMLYSLYRIEIFNTFNKHNKLHIITLFLSIISFIIAFYSPKLFIRHVTHPLLIISILLLVNLKKSIQKIRFSNEYLSHIIIVTGAITYEMYLVHPWIIEYLKLNYITNASFLIFFILTMVIAYLLNSIARQLKF
jgi:hypothetical protein